MGSSGANDGEQAAVGARPEMADGVVLSRTFSWNGDDLGHSRRKANEGTLRSCRSSMSRYYERGYFVPERPEIGIHCCKSSTTAAV